MDIISFIIKNDGWNAILLALGFTIVLIFGTIIVQTRRERNVCDNIPQRSSNTGSTIETTDSDDNIDDNSASNPWITRIQYPGVLAFIAMALCLAYGIIRLELYTDKGNWSIIALLILGAVTISAMVRAFDLPGKVGVWMIFLVTCVFVTFDFINLLLTSLNVIDGPIVDWKSFITLFEGNYLMWIISFILLTIALTIKSNTLIAVLGIGALALILTNYSIVDQKLNEVHASMEKSASLQSLDLPLSAHPEKYGLIMGDGIKATENNDPIRLKCKPTGCYVQVNGLYRINTTKPKKAWDVFPTGNCEIHDILNANVKRQLPSYISTGKRPCFGALMYSTDGYNYKAVIAHNEHLTSDEITRQIGKLKGEYVFIKLYIGKGSYAHRGTQIDVMTFHEKISS